MNKSKVKSKNQTILLKDLVEIFFKEDQQQPNKKENVRRESHIQSQYVLEVLGEEHDENQDNDRVNQGLYYELNIYKSKWEGNTSLIIILTDIKEKIRAQKLQQINDQKDLIMANVTHDLKNPIMGILNFVNEAEELQTQVMPTISKYILNSNLQTTISNINQDIRVASINLLGQSHFLQNSKKDDQTISQFNNKRIQSIKKEHKKTSLQQQILGRKKKSFSEVEEDEQSLQKSQTLKQMIINNNNINSNININSQSCAQLENNNNQQQQQQETLIQLFKIITKIKSITCELQIQVSDIQDINLIKHNKLKLFPKDIDLTELIRDATSIFQEQLKRKRISLQFQPFYKENLILNTDPVRLKQVIVNIVSNSVKYTKTGFISIKIKEKKYDQDAIQISIKDSGKGMSKQIQDKLFKQFNSFDQDTNSYGVGLGLCIIRDLVHYLGPPQQIKVKSQENLGSKFSFKIYKDLSTLQNLISQQEIRQRCTSFLVIDEHNNNSSQNLNISENKIIQPDKTLSFKCLSELNNKQNIKNKQKIQFPTRPSTVSIQNHQILKIFNNENNNSNNNLNNHTTDIINQTINTYNLEKSYTENKFINISYAQSINNNQFTYFNNNLQNSNKTSISSDSSDKQYTSNSQDDQLQIKQQQQQQIKEQQLNKKQIREQNNLSLQQWLESKPNIMIVDDEQYNLIPIKIILNKISKKLNLIEKYDGDEALQYVKDNINLINIIFIDKQMSFMNGDEAAEKINQINPNILIFLLTADNMCINTNFKGISKVLTKPLNLNQLENIKNMESKSN